MICSPATNTQAILLLTAPLLVGRRRSGDYPLSQGEYKSLARLLRQRGSQPSDLLGADAEHLIDECQRILPADRLRRLLQRGLVLSQAAERWETLSIWVVSRADPTYPQLLKTRLKEDAPTLLYGCGDVAMLNHGGLAVVGSRRADPELLDYARRVGRLAAEAGNMVVSGAARGVDQAAMMGGLEGEGLSLGIMADGLEKAVLSREYRKSLQSRHLLLVSPYDPAAGFNVGHAMQRNKVIYAIADVALVVSSDLEKGGTWAGAVEQLERMRSVPVYVRSAGGSQPGLSALEQKGARKWPEPTTASAMKQIFARAQVAPARTEQLLICPERVVNEVQTSHTDTSPGGELFATVRKLLRTIREPKTLAQVATELDVSDFQAGQWLERLVGEGTLYKMNDSERYVASVFVGNPLPFEGT
jgi:DNA processing protein